MSNAAKIGLAVLFTPHFSAGIIAQQAATVSAVNEDGTVNLTVFAPDGYPYGVQRVPFLTDEDATPGDGMYATDATSTKDREAAAANEAGNVGTSASTSTGTGSAEGQTSITSASTEQPHESIIERLEDGAEHLKEEVEHVFHHDSAEGEQSPTA